VIRAGFVAAVALSVIPRATCWSAPEPATVVPRVPARNDGGAGRHDGMGNDSPRPYKEAGREPLDYRGPGRDVEAPDVEEIVLGWFGPGDPDHPEGGDFWRGASLALEEENRAGGCRGKPFNLVPAWSDSPWAAGIVEVTRLVYERGAWALLGATSGASAHLAEQVSLKARLSLVSSGSTDATANMGNVPWLFSCVPSDARQAPVLVDALEAAGASRAFVVAAAADHDAHAALVTLRRDLAARRLTPRSVVEFDPTDLDVAGLVPRLLEAGPHAVVVVAPAISAGRLVAGLRHSGFRGTVIGGATLACRTFLRAAGASAEGALVPRLWEPSERWDAFVGLYQDRWGEPPDYAAAWSYDSVRLVASAVRGAGLNRARIRDTLRALAPWRGVAGELRWDTLGRNERPVGLARWRAGRLEAVTGP